MQSHYGIEVYTEESSSILSHPGPKFLHQLHEIHAEPDIDNLGLFLACCFALNFSLTMHRHRHLEKVFKEKNN